MIRPPLPAAIALLAIAAVALGRGLASEPPGAGAPDPLGALGARPTPAHPPEPQPTLQAFMTEQPGDMLPLGQDALEHLASRRYGAAEAALSGLVLPTSQQHLAGDLAFLVAWLRIRSGKAADALSLLEPMDQASTPPSPYVDLARGEILHADSQHLAAADVLGAIRHDSAIWPRARVLLAEALWSAGRTADSRQVYEDLVSRPDPADGNAIALMALARRATADAAYPLLRRVWSHYPGSEEDAEARRALASYNSPRYAPTMEELATRGDALMAAHRFGDAISLLEQPLSRSDAYDGATCRARYVLGRSHYRRNALTKAHTVLIPVGERCVEADHDRGAKALYLSGKALERKKQWGEAAGIYSMLPRLYPEHSMADDGHLLAGIAWQEAGDRTKAYASWERQVELYPLDDMSGEAHWRLAWGAWLSGRVDDAIGWADKAARDVPIAVDPVHVRAARYWGARWRLFPDRDEPGLVTGDPQLRQEGLEGLAAVIREHPGSYYSLLAAGRLQTLDPERLDWIPNPRWEDREGHWRVRPSFLTASNVHDALALARMGLMADALAELDAHEAEDGELLPGEIGVVTDMMAASGQWLWAHDRLRRYLSSHPPESIDVNTGRLLRATYPHHYEDEVKTACDPHGFDFRLFHALVREESNFNQRIVSHAGARGLSQLMPATARSVGGWMGMKSLSDSDIFKVDTNLAIGARYLAFLLERYKGNPFMALAGYNAGEGNVGRWLRERGNLPVDEFVESIPFRETRGYVKRVSGTWQTYRLLYGDGPAFPDLSAFNDQAVP